MTDDRPTPDATTPTGATPEVLTAWNAELSSALAVPPADIDVILSLAGTAAHAVVRPAAPLTTFLVGYAAGLNARDGSPSSAAVADAVAVARELAERHASPPPEA